MPWTDMSESWLRQQCREWGGGGRLKAGRRGGQTCCSIWGEMMRPRTEVMTVSKRRWNGFGSYGEEFMVVILKCSGGNEPFWESDIGTTVLNAKLADLLFSSISVTSMAGKRGWWGLCMSHSSRFGWAPVISNCIMGFGEIKTEKQYLSGTISITLWGPPRRWENGDIIYAVQWPIL